MTATRRWTLIGLLLGLALGAAVFLASPDWLDGMAQRLQSGRLSPLAAPPLGPTARLALAGALLLGGTLLGWLIGRLFAPARDSVEAEEPTGDVTPDRVSRAQSVEDLGWRAPAGTAAAEPVRAPAPAPLAEAVANDSSPNETALDPISAGPPAPMPTDPSLAEPPRAQIGLVEPAPADSPHQEPMPAYAQPVAPAHAADPSVPAATLARLEATIAELARHDAMRTADRFDGIEARLAQMAQQLAEIAALARTAQRSPAPASPTAAKLVPPADPAQRLAVAQSARALLARLDDHTGRA